MQIDERVEGHVRQAFSAVIGRDGDALAAALSRLSEQDRVAALGLALYVVGFVVNDIYRNGASDEELRTLARQIVDGESNWVTLNIDTVARILRAAATGDASLGGVAKDEIAGNVFISGGHLLGAFSQKGQPWHAYLDEVWAAMEASTEPQ